MHCRSTRTQRGAGHVTRHLTLWAILLAALSATLAAQTPEEQITSAPWFEREVAQGVTWRYYHFDSLFNSEQDIFVTDVDLDTPGVTVRFPYETGGASRVVSSYASLTPGAVALTNGNFGDSSGSVQFLKVDGVVINPTRDATIADEGGIVIDASENVTCRVRPPDPGRWESLTEPHVMASNTNVVSGGVQWPLWPDIPFYFGDRHPRTVVGKTPDNHFLLVAVDGRSPTAAGMTYEELATTMIALGCTDAVGLDGGGSTTMWITGEPGSGVVNTPSDGSERSVVNAVAVIAPPSTATLAWDSRHTATSAYENTMISGETQTVWMEFENYGTETWTSNTRLGTTEDRDRDSELHTAGDWLSTNRVTAADQATVAPGETGRFTFTVTAPDVSTPTDLVESFGLIEEGVDWFGPEQSRLRITVLPEGGIEGNIIIESRAGGQNVGWYAETGGWADSGTDCTALGMTPGIGMRYGSTYRSVAGLKTATFTPVITQAGMYNVYVTWGAGSNRRSGITLRVHHSGGVDESLVDQSASANEWYPLGTHHFDIGTGGYVEVSNESTDVSGSMYTAGAIFEPVTSAGSAAGNWIVYR
ncbi:phosphodiester glycosidase family protein [Candidatus Sumerlaeota bacterium]|nr:phosphodiester glycosidase family protein [Candidatus Sumerlaeota bacterium]